MRKKELKYQLYKKRKERRWRAWSIQPLPMGAKTRGVKSYMILYLARNESINHLDMAASEQSLHIRKLSGTFSLSEFIIRDMRKYSSCRCFCVERQAIIENEADFIEALQSFQMMFSARIIVLLDGAGDNGDIVRQLTHIGVNEIVTASDESERHRQIAECLSDEGMLRQRPAVEPRALCGEADRKSISLAESLILDDTEDEQYRFDCANVKIGVIGATRRVGATTIALGLANYIQNHGGTACYASFNLNRHLGHIAEMYDFDVEEDYYTHGAVDFYEAMKPKHDYNFIVMDFGDLGHGEIRRETAKAFKDCSVHLLCGASGTRFEVADFEMALRAVKSAHPKILTYAPHPAYDELFRATVTKEPAIVIPVGDMLDYTTNAPLYKEIIQQYIVETSKRL